MTANAAAIQDLHLTNMTDGQVAFKVKTTKRERYLVKPAQGVIDPRSLAVVRGAQGAENSVLGSISHGFATVEMQARQVNLAIQEAVEKGDSAAEECVLRARAQRPQTRGRAFLRLASLSHHAAIASWCSVCACQPRQRWRTWET